MIMRSEAEIRRLVEMRLRRWGLLALNGVLWAGAAKLIYGYSQYRDLHGVAADVIIPLMLVWLIVFGLHALRTFYVEGREWLVKWAIRREHQVYGWQPIDEKPKRRESASLPDESRFSLPDEGAEYPGVPFRYEADGELGEDFPFQSDGYEPKASADHER